MQDMMVFNPPTRPADLQRIMNAYNVRAYGADNTGATDTAAAILAADTAAQATGGIVYFPPGTYRCDSQLTLANDGASPVSKMKPRMWMGAGAWQSGAAPAPAPIGGTILDLRYSSGPCLFAKPNGMLSITGITFTQLGTAHTQPYIKTTNTVLQIFLCSFVGHSTKTGTFCDQDAIVLGGTTTNINMTDTAAFQGYGVTIERNWFNHIRRGVYGRMYSNAVTIQNNNFWTECGGVAAIEFDGGGDSINFSIGGTITGNLIECIYYNRAMKFNYTSLFMIGPNHFYDGSGIASDGFIEIGNFAYYNTIIAGSYSGSKPLVTQVNNNTIINPSQSQTSYFTQYVNFTNTTTISNLLCNGGSGKVTIKPATDGGNSARLFEVQDPAGAVLFRLQQAGNITLGGGFDGLIAAATWQIGPGGWKRTGGGAILISTETDSSNADIKCYALRIQNNAGTTQHQFGQVGVGFYGTAQTAKQTVTGSRGGNAALASLLTALENIGLITDSSTA